MNLTKEQQSLLDGSKGETMAKVVKTLVMYGEAFDAERMVPVAEGFGHTGYQLRHRGDDAGV